jgi:hypothetical protein
MRVVPRSSTTQITGGKRMKRADLFRLVLPLSWLVFGSLGVSAENGQEIPQDRELVTVLIRCGLQDTTPSKWDGTFQLQKGRIVATDGLRFTGDDYVTVETFQLDVRRFYPRFWNRRGRDPSSLPIEPNGFRLTVADVSPSSVSR